MTRVSEMGHPPVYQRIRDDIAASIRSGELPAEGRLMSEAALSERYGVARMTVRQAIAQLVQDNLIVRHQGVGTFVSKDATNRRSLNRLTGFSEDMRSNGQVAQTVMLAQEICAPSEEVARYLGLDAGVQAIRLERLRRVKGEPIILQESWLRYGRFPALAREALVDGSLYRTLETRYGVRLRRAEQHLTAVPASRRQAVLLGAPTRSALLKLERLAVDDRNELTEFARSWTRPGFKFTVHLER